jgi:hypothetical protein
MQELTITAAVLRVCDIPRLGGMPNAQPRLHSVARPRMATYAATIRSQTGPEAYMRGRVMLLGGQHTEAEALFSDMLRRKVANWGPEYPAAIGGLARAARASGNVDKARTTYDLS